MARGETDDWGYQATVNKLEMHDLHATMLHLIGMTWFNRALAQPCFPSMM